MPVIYDDLRGLVRGQEANIVALSSCRPCTVEPQFDEHTPTVYAELGFGGTAAERRRYVF